MAQQVALGVFSKGGMFRGGKALCKEHQFATFDYGGKGPATTALAVTLVPFDGEELDEENEKVEYFGLGDKGTQSFAPNPDDDGKSLIVKSNAPLSQPSESCKYALYINSVFKPTGGGPGFPREKLGADISVLDGMIVELAQFDMKKLSPGGGVSKSGGLKGLSGAAAATAAAPPKEDQDNKCLKVVEIYQMPGTKTKATAKAKVAPAEPEPEPEAEEGADEELSAMASKLAFKVVKAAGKAGISKKKLIGDVFAANKKDPNIKAVMGVLGDDDWLAAEDRPWNYDADTGTLKPV